MIALLYDLWEGLVNKLWSFLITLLFITSVSAQDLTIVPNYINGVRIQGALLDDINDVIGGVNTLCELEDVTCGDPTEETILTRRSGTYQFVAPTPVSGAAGGILEGTYPNPSGIVNGSLQGADFADGAIPQSKLESTAVTPGTYGSTTQSVQIVVGAKGTITGISNQAISGVPTGSVGPAELESTATTPGLCGSATEVCQVTTDEDGRIIAQTEIAIEAASVPEDIVIDSLRYDAVVETTTCDMTYSSHKITPSGTTTCTLPAANAAGPGVYIIDVINANSVVMAVTGADLLNGTNGSMAAVTGPLATINCHNLDDTSNWRCSVTRPVTTGNPWFTYCTGIDGGANTANTGAGSYVEHTLECDLPSGKLTTGSILRICSGWHITTDATPPALSMRWLANDVVLNSIVNIAPAVSYDKNLEVCARVIVNSPPQAGASLFTTPIGTLSDILTGHVMGGITLPTANVNTSAGVEVTMATQWSVTDTVTNSIDHLYMTVEGSGLLP